MKPTTKTELRRGRVVAVKKAAAETTPDEQAMLLDETPPVSPASEKPEPEKHR